MKILTKAIEAKLIKNRKYLKLHYKLVKNCFDDRAIVICVIMGFNDV